VTSGLRPCSHSQVVNQLPVNKALQKKGKSKEKKRGELSQVGLSGPTPKDKSREVINQWGGKRKGGVVVRSRRNTQRFGRFGIKYNERGKKHLGTQNFSATEGKGRRIHLSRGQHWAVSSPHLPNRPFSPKDRNLRGGGRKDKRGWGKGPAGRRGTPIQGALGPLLERKKGCTLKVLQSHSGGIAKLVTQRSLGS